MEVLKKYSFLILLFIAQSSFAQISFHKLFSGNGYDYGYGLAQTEDSSYLVVGASSSFLEAPSQALLMKTDSLGNFKWSNVYGGSGSEEFRRVKYIEDYCIYLGGFSTSQSNGVFDNYLVKTNVDGVVEWETTFGGTDWDRIVDMAVLPDSSLFIVGSTFSFGNGAKDWSLYRYDKNGNEMWSNYLGSAQDDEIKSCAYYEGFLYAAGSMYNSDSLMQKATISRIDLTGTEDWRLELDMASNTIVEDFVITNDDKIRGTGSVYNVYDTSSEVLFFSADIDGTSNGNFKQNGTEEMHGINIVTELDSTGLYLNILGRNEPGIGIFEDGFYDTFIAGFNNSFGFDNFAFNFSKTKDDIIYDMIMSLDNGAAMVGEQNFFDESGSQLCLIKIGPNRETTQPDDSELDNVVMIEEINNLQVTIFPNPTSGLFNVETSSANYSLSIKNLQGKVVLENNNIAQLNISNLQCGVYFLRIESEKFSKEIKLVKQ